MAPAANYGKQSDKNDTVMIFIMIVYYGEYGATA
jgi:hypothetical protein